VRTPTSRSGRSLAGALLWAATAGAGACGGGSSGDGPPCAAASGNICTIAGTGTAGDGVDRQPALHTDLYLPQDVTVAPAPDGRVFVSDWNNHRIRVLEKDGTMTIVAGVGELGLSADDPSTDRLNHPTNVAFDAQGHLVIAAWHNSRIKIVDLATLAISDLYGNGQRGFSGDGMTADLAALNLPVAIVYDASWNMIIADQANDRLRRVDATTHIITSMAGTGPCGGCALGDGGPATSASFSFPAGQAAQPGGRIDIDAGGNIYVADTSNGRVRKIDSSGLVSTLAGNGMTGYGGDGGPAVDAMLNQVNDVAAAPDGSVYLADTENDCVRVVRPDGTIAAAAGTCGQRGFAGDGGPATGALLNRPTGVALDGAGNLYVADAHNHRIRVVYR
jgi:DNA-binding beta-propeller fold protein YncE